MSRWFHITILLLTLIVGIASFIVLSIFFSTFKSLSFRDDKKSFNAPTPYLDDDWMEWTKRFNVSFDSATESLYRYSVWRKNVDFMQAHNEKPGVSYKMGVNQFSHMEHWEFVDTYLRSKRVELDNYDLDNYFEGNSTVKVNKTLTSGDCYLDPLDWRKEVLGSKVDDQGTCGSCWAFASVSTLEWHNAIHNAAAVPLSKQHFVDCVTTSFGCHGGLIENAFKYAMQRGIMGAEVYPYKSRVTQCREDEKAIVLKIRGYETLAGVNEAVLSCIVKRVGPVVIGFDASGLGLQHYKSGVYDGTDCSMELLNHAVVLLGYGRAADGSLYWIAQNSFSNRWGEDGFFRIKFDSNLCGIGATPILPIL